MPTRLLIGARVARAAKVVSCWAVKPEKKCKPCLWRSNRCTDLSSAAARSFKSTCWFGDFMINSSSCEGFDPFYDLVRVHRYTPLPIRIVHVVKASLTRPSMAANPRH
jgi:hypothetical protein